MSGYDHREIEAKWQWRWQEARAFCCDMDRAAKPFYNLMMFPYPSAEGLHVGNVYAFTGSDIFGRYHRLKGFDVFEPMGFDAFGIHSENYAIKTGTHPAKLIPANVHNFRENQLKRLGAMFDWEHEVDTTDPDYYKWTQWIFIQLFKAGLAYQKSAPVNWCPSCATVLSDEQAEGGLCERCDSKVETREMKQWFFRISAFAPRLLANLDWIDWSDKTKIAQREWIGESDGAHIDFALDGGDQIRVFTTRPDTLFGATYMVLAPEHEAVGRITTPEQRAAVDAYVARARAMTKFERSESKAKTGVFTGAYAINPVNDTRIPVWIADYVLTGYGTGAIMAVPAHDTRDFEFAKEFGLPIIEVITPDGERHDLAEAYTGEGTMIHSGPFDGVNSLDAIAAITDYVANKGAGEATKTYRLRDWCISRQRYWGPPIPMIHCEKCGTVPVPDADLPVVLPEMSDITPDGSGLSVLARNAAFVNVACPSCGGAAKRDTDVNDNFLDSAWYFFRYPSTDFADRAFDRERTKRWLPVDAYIGGNEHAVLHLMYTRFITMALHDMGLIDFEEPFKKFRAHGLITKDGAKMSKSKGNVVNPDAFLDEFGADAFRMYLMFLGPYQQGGDWRDAGIIGVRRFLYRVWRYVAESDLAPGLPGDRELVGAIHRTIRKVTRDLDELSYNTAIAAMMELMNELERAPASREAADILVRLITPFSPHISEELFEQLGGEGFASHAPWPTWDESLCERATVTIAVQVNGKLRGTIEAAVDADAASIIAAAKAVANVAEHLAGKTIVKEVAVPGRLVNFVVK
ncbi:MAG: leucine--tRNA ligase [Deltaproteobacteria bacterium]|nr:leucine--tRNA ligase [Deltaproteobacteria bacterium]